MKKLLLLTFTFMIVFIFAACGNHNEEEINSNDRDTMSHSSNEQDDTSDESERENSQDSILNDANLDSSDSRDERIRLTFNNEEIIVKIYDNPTSRDFLSQLPLILTFEDFGGFEKLAYPPDTLTTEGAPSGYDPSPVDFSYFSPWGNVTLFYKTHRFSNGLVKMGEIESGAEMVESLPEGITILIEKTD